MTQIILGDHPCVRKLTGDASHGINSSMGNTLTNPPIITSVAQEYGTHDLSPTLPLYMDHDHVNYSPINMDNRCQQKAIFP